VIIDAEQHPAHLRFGHLVGEALDVEPVHEAVPAFRGHLRERGELRSRPQRGRAVRVAEQDAVLIVQEDAVLRFQHPTRVARAGKSRHGKQQRSDECHERRAE